VLFAGIDFAGVGAARSSLVRNEEARMKHVSKLGLVAALAASAMAIASTQGAETNPYQGADKRAVNLCSSCHGPRGVSTSPEFPILAAQSEIYLVMQMKAFRNKVRNEKEAHQFMWGVAQQMDDAAIAAVARYYAEQAPAGGRPAETAMATKGKELFEKGAPERGISACATCHGKNAEGGSEGPRLASQHAKYIEKQLRYMQTKERDAATMGEVVKKLTLEEAQAVAAYVQSLS